MFESLTSIIYEVFRVVYHFPLGVLFFSHRELETAEFRYCEVHDSCGCALFICSLASSRAVSATEKGWRWISIVD